MRGPYYISRKVSSIYLGIVTRLDHFGPFDASIARSFLFKPISYILVFSRGTHYLDNDFFAF